MAGDRIERFVVHRSVFTATRKFITSAFFHRTNTMLRVSETRRFDAVTSGDGAALLINMDNKLRSHFLFFFFFLIIIIIIIIIKQDKFRVP